MSEYVCFATGTLIRTTRGDAPIETLNIGEHVLNSAGERRRIKWIGRRSLDLRLYSDPDVGYPVRIARDAFGPNRPMQDLFVSRGHAICVDLCGEVLIPASALVNGATIARMPVDHVTYWHVELESHDILIANGLPAESFIDMGNRAFFEEGGASIDMVDLDAPNTHADYCRPLVWGGPILGFVRERLAARAEAIGWERVRDANLRFVVDGTEHRPIARDGKAVFRFPSSTKEARLSSDLFAPAALGASDARVLGVALLGLSFSDRAGQTRNVSLDDKRIAHQFHPQEAANRNAWRWTRGDVALAPELWNGLSGEIELLVSVDDGPTRGWRRAELRPASSKKAGGRSSRETRLSPKKREVRAA